MNKFAIFLTAIAFVALSAPVTGYAATAKPICTLSANTNRGTFETENSGKIMFDLGMPITLEWASENALKASGNGKPVEIAGSKVVTPTKTTTYSYTFSSGSKKTTCSITAVLANAEIDYYSLTSIKSKPTITGTAKGLTSVRVLIEKDIFSDEVVYEKVVKVRKGVWKLKVPKALKDGVYEVNLRGSDDLALNYIVSGRLTVSSGGVPFVSVSTQFPGNATVSGGTRVPFATAYITNTSKGLATINGLWVKLSGNMPELGVIGLEMDGDNGEGNGASGMIEGYTPFKDKTAYLPGTVTLSPGETRTLTMKAAFSGNSAYRGKQAKLSIYQFATTAGVSGAFADKGPTFTIK